MSLAKVSGPPTPVHASPALRSDVEAHVRFSGVAAAPAAPGRDVQPTLLLVDSVEINRQHLKGLLKAAPYRILEARRPTEALEILERESVDLIIADLVMPEMGGPDFCRLVKSNRHSRLIPLLIITSIRGIENEIVGFEAGADEFLIKPLQPAAVRTRVRAMLRNKRAIDSLEEAETILFALAQAVEQRDKDTGDHCARLSRLSVQLGAMLGLEEDDLLALHRGGYLHDIGKISIPDAILFKRGPLTEDEWAIMRDHTLKGVEICTPMKSLAPVLPIIRNHHERWDGSGYPDRLAGEEIPLTARIMQLADIYDALTSPRSYKPAFSQQKALEILRQEAGMGWRDPELTPVFCEMIAQEDPAREIDELDRMRQSLVNMGRELGK